MAQDTKPSLESARIALRTVLQYIGEDPDREGLLETPDRIVRSWSKLYGGYAEDPAALLKKAFTEVQGYDQLIVLRDIEFYSTCEHHALPFFGKAHIGYIPRDRVVGISKLARLVEVYARRLQIQERLTQQIADALDQHLKPRGVGVIVEAQHFCMVARGVEKQNSVMSTSALRGILLNEPGAKAEFMKLIERRSA